MEDESLARLQTEEFNHYDIMFSGDVTGLQVGGPVRFRGVPVGEVIDFKVDPEHIEQVRVTIQIKEGTPVRADSVASLEVQGITGVLYVLISGGTDFTLRALDLASGEVLWSEEVSGAVSGGAAVVSDASGIATFAALSIDLAGSKQLSATSGAIPSHMLFTAFAPMASTVWFTNMVSCVPRLRYGRRYIVITDSESRRVALGCWMQLRSKLHMLASNSGAWMFTGPVSVDRFSGSVQSTAHQSTWADFLSSIVQVAPPSGLTLIGDPYTRAATSFLLLPVGSRRKQPGSSVRPLGCVSLMRLNVLAPSLER